MVERDQRRRAAEAAAVSRRQGRADSQNDRTESEEEVETSGSDSPEQGSQELENQEFDLLDVLTSIPGTQRPHVEGEHGRSISIARVQCI